MMFYASMGRFQLELIFITYFSTVVPFNSCVFLSCRPFVVNTTFSTGLVNDERPTGKKNTTIEWDDGGTIGNKNKLIPTSYEFRFFPEPPEA